jgi:TPR repeat protein
MRALSVMILLVALILPSGHASASPPIDISAEELQTLHTHAAQGDADAQNNLGTLYEKGQGVSQDYTKARQWFEKAAAQGSVAAQNNLGVLYASGQGVPQDYATARQ